MRDHLKQGKAGARALSYLIPVYTPIRNVQLSFLQEKLRRRERQELPKLRQRRQRQGLNPVLTTYLPLRETGVSCFYISTPSHVLIWLRDLLLPDPAESRTGSLQESEGGAGRSFPLECCSQ